MKATVRTERFYDIEIGGVMKEGWREVSSWNGLKELERKGQRLIVTTEQHLDLFDIFGVDIGCEKNTAIHVLTASPDLFQWLRGEVKA